MNTLLLQGHEVAVATREMQNRVLLPGGSNPGGPHPGGIYAPVFSGREFDVVYDDLAYCSNDEKCA